ncbi:MAG: hypothetical protein ABMA64_31210, partial [Myxococcota bacterium]
MGKGGARELQSGNQEVAPIRPELAARLEQALGVLDQLNPTFKSGRDEERYAQTTKAWHRVCAEVDHHLRTLGKALVESHQLSLDIGSDGGGVNAKPWIEEIGGSLDRLWFKLDGAKVVAFFGQRGLGEASLYDLTYEWVEQMVVEWVVAGV